MLFYKIWLKIKVINEKISNWDAMLGTLFYTEIIGILMQELLKVYSI